MTLQATSIRLRRIDQPSIKSFEPDRTDREGTLYIFHPLFTIFLLRRTSWIPAEWERTIWRTWNATAADTTRVSIKPPRAGKSRDVEIPAAFQAAGRPNSLCLCYNTILLHFPRDSAFLSFPPPRPPPYIYDRSGCNPDTRGRGGGGRGLLNRGIDFRLKCHNPVGIILFNAGRVLCDFEKVVSR